MFCFFLALLLLTNSTQAYLRNVHNHSSSVSPPPQHRHLHDHVQHSPKVVRHERAVDLMYFLYFNSRYNDHDFNGPKGEWWKGLSWIQSMSTDTHPIRIHIVSNDQWIQQNIAQKQLPYIYHGFDESLQHNFTEFRKIYKHISVNGEEYEYICFYRWTAYAHIINTWRDEYNLPMEFIMTLDLDVLMVQNPQSMVSHLVQLHNQEKHPIHTLKMVMLTPGAGELWTRHGLLEFDAYMWRWFDRPMDEYRKDVDKYGDTIYNRRHFSDMYLLVHYLRQNFAAWQLSIGYNATSPTNTIFPWMARYYGGYVEPEWNNPTVYHSLIGCFPLRLFIEFKTFNVSISYNKALAQVDVNIYVANKYVPFCYLHFQGDTKGYFKEYHKQFIDLTVSALKGDE